MHSEAENSAERLPAGEVGWLTVEVQAAALQRNLAHFRQRIGTGSRLLAVVKANGYGHGIEIAARAFLSGGADMLGVHSLPEALQLRDAGLEAPILILGPVTAAEARLANQLAVEITVGSVAAVQAACHAVERPGHTSAELNPGESAGAETRTLQVHLKVETGVNRQGILETELPEVLSLLDDTPGVELAGVASHFADIEDTTDHRYAHQQMDRFERFLDQLAEAGHDRVCRHMSCSAAAILWESSYRDLVRVGISAYGFWPSRETQVTARMAGKNELTLEPALTWKCRVAQVKDVPAGETVGYGRAWKAMTDTRIAVLPVGYADGYLRGLSGQAHVLVRGSRAPIRGRICMNLCMVDVTHIPGVCAGDEVVLLGRQGDEVITVEQLAGYLNTIAYEVVTLPGPTWQRVEI